MPPHDLSVLESQLSKERMKVDVAQHNFSVRELVRMILEEELNVAPAYQRKFRWSEDNESGFIESIFLGLPIPPIFVATNDGFQWEVVDGLQRLSTLMHFAATSNEDLRFTNKHDPLTLSGLEKLSQLNGVRHSDLPRSLQIYFGRQPLQVISLTDKSDLAVRFDVFERLNKGALSLSSQEVRACIYRGDFNDFLETLAENSAFTGLLKLQELRQNDGTAAEQVLKFFAYKNSRETFDGRVERFLNRYMKTASKGFDFKTEKAAFENAVDTLSAAFSGGPFLRKNHNLTPLVQFEAALVAVAELLAQGISVVNPPEDWLSDHEFRGASGAGSNTRAMLGRRIERAKALLSGHA